MVKSYQGAVIEKVKDDKDQPVLVSDWMTTRLITFRPEQPIYEVIDKLLSNKISGAPVVNDKNEVVGVISEGDCLKEIVKGKYDNIPTLAGKVSDHMSTNVMTIEPTKNVFEVGQTFLNLRLRRLPVIDKFGKLIGQISQKDVMRAVRNMRSSTW